jgi:hypothetical protein
LNPQWLMAIEPCAAAAFVKRDTGGPIGRPAAARTTKIWMPPATLQLRSSPYAIRCGGWTTENAPWIVPLDRHQCDWAPTEFIADKMIEKSRGPRLEGDAERTGMSFGETRLRGAAPAQGGRYIGFYVGGQRCAA